jgi:hypothetical protein
VIGPPPDPHHEPGENSNGASGEHHSGSNTGEALQRHVQRLLLDAGGLGGEAQLLQRLNPDPDLVRGLADRIGCTDRAVDKRREPADRRDPDQRAAEGSDAGAQQLRLAAEALQPPGGALARTLDALQALLAALADRDQSSAETPPASRSASARCRPCSRISSLTSRIALASASAIGRGWLGRVGAMSMSRQILLMLAGEMPARCSTALGS